MEREKKGRTLKEILLMKIPPLFAWSVIGGLSSAVLITLVALILRA